MSKDCRADTGSSVNADGNRGTITDIYTEACADTSVKSSQDIDLAVSECIDNHHNVSLHRPISTDDAGIQTSFDRKTSRTKKSGRSKATNFLPCIRLVVFILVIIVLLLICNLEKTHLLMLFIYF